jgi:hypothetical protein
MLAQAMAIASIAHWDWPGEWPGLIEELGNAPRLESYVSCVSALN